MWLDKLSFSVTDEFVVALSRHGISSLTMNGRHVTFEGISEFCRGTTLRQDNVRMLRLYALSNVQKVVDEIIKVFSLPLESIAVETLGLLFTYLSLST